MNQETNRKHIESEFDNLRKHPIFAQSQTLIRLMRYLIDKSLAKEELKEFTIGSDLYGINYAEDKGNGTVRSYFYKLRKKLNQYYDDSQIKHLVVFEIKKGQYNLSFLSPTDYYKTKNNNYLQFRVPHKTIQYVSIGIGLALSTAILTLFLMNCPSDLWANYFQTEAKNIIVVSDHYVVNEKLNDDEWHAVLYNEIHCHDDFMHYAIKHPNQSIKTTDYTVISKMAPYCISSLSHWFFRHNSHYSIEMESDLTASEAANNNIIFIGQFKTMNISSSLFLKNSKVFTTHNDGFKYSTKDTTIFYNTKFKPSEKVEYAMVSSSINSKGNQSIYFVSNNDIGAMATVSNFTNEQWLKEFFGQFDSYQKTFNALFKVEGIKRVDFNCELVQIEFLH